MPKPRQAQKNRMAELPPQNLLVKNMKFLLSWNGSISKKEKKQVREVS